MGLRRWFSGEPEAEVEVSTEPSPEAVHARELAEAALAADVRRTEEIKSRTANYVTMGGRLRHIREVNHFREDIVEMMRGN